MYNTKKIIKEVFNLSNLSQINQIKVNYISFNLKIKHLSAISFSKPLFWFSFLDLNTIP